MYSRTISSLGEPRGAVTVDAVLFEEPAKYGPAFVLRLFEFLNASDPGSPETIRNIHSVCQTVLRKHIGAEGTLSPHSGDSGFFVFRFGHIGDTEASRRAQAAVNEIGRILLGDRFAPSDIAEDRDWNALPRARGEQPATQSDGAGVRREAYDFARDDHTSKDSSIRFDQSQRRQA